MLSRLRWQPLLVLAFFSVLGTAPARAADCAQATSVAEIDALLLDAEAAYATLDAEGFTDKLEEVLLTIPSTSIVLV